MSSAISQQEFEQFRDLLEDVSGIVLGDNKRYLIASRLSHIFSDNGLDSLGALVAQLKKAGTAKLREQVIDAMTTNETLWFRDGYPFELLANDIFPSVAERKPRTIRLWSAACSSGQEPYSISMVIEESLAARPNSLPPVEIVATDISPAILSEAQEGIYDSVSLARGMSEARKQKFFKPHGARWQVKDELRRRVRFRSANLLDNYNLLGRFDIIFCRNVLIYFSAEAKREILARMARCLNPGGYLMLGSSEAVTQYSDEFELVRFSKGAAYRVKDGLALAPAKALPAAAAKIPPRPSLATKPRPTAIAPKPKTAVGGTNRPPGSVLPRRGR